MYYAIIRTKAGDFFSSVRISSVSKAPCAKLDPRKNGRIFTGGATFPQGGWPRNAPLGYGLARTDDSELCWRWSHWSPGGYPSNQSSGVSLKTGAISDNYCHSFPLSWDYHGRLYIVTLFPCKEPSQCGATEDRGLVFETRLSQLVLFLGKEVNRHCYVAQFPVSAHWAELSPFKCLVNTFDPAPNHPRQVGSIVLAFRSQITK